MIKGRHVIQNHGTIAPELHELHGIGKPDAFVMEVKSNGVIRIDDENHHEFWLEIQLTDEQIKTLSKKTE